MISRYQRRAMAELWSLESQYAAWLEVELAVCRVQAEMGLIPAEVPAEIEAKAVIDVERIAAIEENVRHDVIAFVTQIEETAGPAARWFHYGLTSSDVLDTALSLRLTRAMDIILNDLDELLTVLRDRAHEFKDAPIIGRSHGIHAEPTTFGLKLAIFYDEFRRRRRCLLAARRTIAVGQCSGPVGNFSAPGISPEVEERALARLGLSPAPASSQIIQRDRHAEYFTALALLASSMEKLAVEIRHLARTELGEVEEPFGKSQKGSSAMPHKKNPVGSENISGLARVVRANSLAAMEDVPLWHERDISHSSVERIIAPDSASLTDYMLARLSSIVRDMIVHPERMAENINLAGGLHNSQQLLLCLCGKGLSRVEAYAHIQRNALRAHHERSDFKTLLLEDAALAQHLSAEEIEAVFTPDRFFAATEAIFKRVFDQPND
ncbi:MAG: adenylosuccinate lyase [Candidatus Adiutrix sp.]|jgi:adenylosuccinate lyase|nr:adenylosuccinate lyase [Candidatus Adiutrix sp.]